MRPGEALGRRWRDFEDAKPLVRMHVHTQYDDQPLKGARDEYTAERMVPLHPTLWKLLEEWRCVGWERHFGRLPRPDDFVLPDPRDITKARTRNQYSKALKRDQKHLGLETVGMHGGRRFFITQARQAGADKDLVRQITHAAKGDILDGYTHWEWESLCSVVSQIECSLGGGELIRMPLRRVAPKGHLGKASRGLILG